MIYPAQTLSDFEKCAKLPQIKSKWEPDHWPIREAVKQSFLGGLLSDPESVADEFLLWASNLGFEYPEGDHYELAKDYASWLDGALRILQEESGNLQSLPLFPFFSDNFTVPGYLSETGHNVVRVVSELGNHGLRWPELVVLGIGDVDGITVHQFRLPPLRKNRLISPLSLAYQQPLIGRFRLAKLNGEPGKFGTNWRRKGRWELPEIGWDEWRRGIDRDQCMNQIHESYVVEGLKREDRKRLINDIEHILVSMEKSTHPRKWEACENCIFSGVCHGNKEGFTRKTVQRTVVQRERETAVVLQ